MLQKIYYNRIYLRENKEGQSEPENNQKLSGMGAFQLLITSKTFFHQ